jgi:hypothetical protein
MVCQEKERKKENQLKVGEDEVHMERKNGGKYLGSSYFEKLFDYPGSKVCLFFFFFFFFKTKKKYILRVIFFFFFFCLC